ncbi:uncharacterized protein BJ212DRAFT_1307518 [Suillus subaureus]|uniref:Secreted protein n=1 Tax=Suillus subaureus TaxID=48587 RepID=A0A9P7AMQ1_9AGAM|nr:uncharacterized protein BJ212DRAFT_1307518 [Suillus subaureus]KAG1791637.1 hypothetical protein BJ212DRAFT_1307518 [Suillus subaureus]
MWGTLWALLCSCIVFFRTKAGNGQAEPDSGPDPRKRAAKRCIEVKLDEEIVCNESRKKASAAGIHENAHKNPSHQSSLEFMAEKEIQKQQAAGMTPELAGVSQPGRRVVGGEQKSRAAAQ